MKLTKQQRHMAYMIMLASIEINKDKCFLCHCLEADGVVESFHDGIEILLWLTELAGKRTGQHVWFVPTNGAIDEKSLRKVRIAALKQCIEETADAWPK